MALTHVVVPLVCSLLFIVVSTFTKYSDCMINKRRWIPTLGIYLSVKDNNLYFYLVGTVVPTYLHCVVNKWRLIDSELRLWPRLHKRARHSMNGETISARQATWQEKCKKGINVLISEITVLSDG